MNNNRRKAIKEATEDFKEKLADLMYEYRNALDDILQEEQEAYDNLPESIQDSDRGYEMDEGIQTISDLIDNLENEDLEEVADGIETMYDSFDIN